MRYFGFLSLKEIWRYFSKLNIFVIFPGTEIVREINKF